MMRLLAAALLLAALPAFAQGAPQPDTAHRDDAHATRALNDAAVRDSTANAALYVAAAGRDYRKEFERYEAARVANEVARVEALAAAADYRTARARYESDYARWQADTAAIRSRTPAH